MPADLWTLTDRASAARLSRAVHDLLHLANDMESNADDSDDLTAEARETLRDAAEEIRNTVAAAYGISRAR